MLSWEGVGLRRIGADAHSWIWVIGARPFCVGLVVGRGPKPFVGGLRGRTCGDNLKGATRAEGEGGTNSWD